MTSDEKLHMEKLQKEYLKNNKIKYCVGSEVVSGKRAYNLANKKIMNQLALSIKQNGVKNEDYSIN